MGINETFKIIMKEYLTKKKEESFNSSSSMFKLINYEAKEVIENTINDLDNIGIDLDVKSSCGAGGWTKYPWIAIFNREITNTIQEGVYIVYLFSEDMQRVYLTLNQGYTNLKNSLGTKESRSIMIKKRDEIRDKIKEIKFAADNELKVGKREYEEGCIFYKEYSIHNFPQNREFIEDLQKMIELYKQYFFKIYKYDTHQVKTEEISQGVFKYEGKKDSQDIDKIHLYITGCGFLYSKQNIKNLYLSLKTKPFVILSGISGTGKSKLAKLFAESLGSTSENERFTLIPVRPDWSDSSDLIGYKDLNGTFHPGILTTTIEKAINNTEHPYIVCLDEMNLARVEYYLSDILSVIESRYIDTDGKIKTDKLIRKELLGDDEETIKKYGNIYIPENLYIIGTVNMDETTFPFSKKVLDRANTIEFNEVNLGFNFELFEQQQIEQKEFSNNFLKSKYLKLTDCKEEKEIATEIINELININNILEKYNQHFGYRVRDEIVYYCIYALKDNLFTKEEAMDYCVVQKILPKIGGSDEDTLDLLLDLYNYITNEDKAYTREDAYNNVSMKINDKYKLTNKKISIMVRRFVRDGFTNFWQ